MLEKYRNVIFAAVIIAIASGIIALLTYRPAPVTITIIPPGPTPTALPLRVYVTGAVKNPQRTYTIPPGSRIQDAIDAAGGSLPNADLVRINLAQVLRDGDQVNVPASVVAADGPTAQALSAPSGTAAPETKATSGPIHINRATLEELEQLPGVGPSLAKNIIDYRNSHGPFQSLADLDQVPGIGESKLKQIADYVVFD